jgi:ATP synthase protein I
MAEREDGEEEDRVLRARLEKLSSALEAQRKASQQRREAGGGDQTPGGSGAAMASAMRAGGEFVAAIIVGGFTGWLLDVWLGTKPWLMIAFFFLGVTAGIVNVIRAASPPRRRDQAEQNGRSNRNEGEGRGG